MCGRFTLATTQDQLSSTYGLSVDPPAPRFNIAPTQDVLLVRKTPENGTTSGIARWGLVPEWADDLSIGSKCFNARGETVLVKPAFKAAIQRRRGILPMSGFFEWTEKSRRAWYIFGEELLSAAAIWESWTDGDQVVESCSMLTRPADDFMAEVHDRMPIFLSPEDFEPWLDDHPIGTPEIQSYLQKSVPLERHEVATKVNDLSQDSSELIQKINPIQGSLFG